MEDISGGPEAVAVHDPERLLAVKSGNEKRMAEFGGRPATLSARKWRKVGAGHPL